MGHFSACGHRPKCLDAPREGLVECIGLEQRGVVRVIHKRNRFPRIWVHAEARSRLLDVAKFFEARRVRRAFRHRRCDVVGTSRLFRGTFEIRKLLLDLCSDGGILGSSAADGHRAAVPRLRCLTLQPMPCVLIFSATHTQAHARLHTSYLDRYNTPVLYAQQLH